MSTRMTLAIIWLASLSQAVAQEAPTENPGLDTILDELRQSSDTFVPLNDVFPRTTGARAPSLRVADRFRKRAISPLIDAAKQLRKSKEWKPLSNAVLALGFIKPDHVEPILMELAEDHEVPGWLRALSVEAAGQSKMEKADIKRLERLGRDPTFLVRFVSLTVQVENGGGGPALREWLDELVFANVVYKEDPPEPGFHLFGGATYRPLVLAVKSRVAPNSEEGDWLPLNWVGGVYSDLHLLEWDAKARVFTKLPSLEGPSENHEDLSVEGLAQARRKQNQVLIAHIAWKWKDFASKDVVLDDGGICLGGAITDAILDDRAWTQREGPAVAPLLKSTIACLSQIGPAARACLVRIVVSTKDERHEMALDALRRTMGSEMARQYLLYRAQLEEHAAIRKSLLEAAREIDPADKAVQPQK